MPSLALLIADRVAKKRGIGGKGSADEGDEPDEPDEPESDEEEATEGPEPDKKATAYASDLRRALDDGDDNAIVEAIRGICG